MSELSPTEVEALAKLRAHKHFDIFVAQCEVDLEEWLALRGTSGEDYEGEAQERAGLFELVIQLCTGKPYRPMPVLRLVTGGTDATDR